MAYYPRTRTNVWAGPSLLTMIYLLVGVIVAATRDYSLSRSSSRRAYRGASGSSSCLK